MLPLRQLRSVLPPNSSYIRPSQRFRLSSLGSSRTLPRSVAFRSQDTAKNMRAAQCSESCCPMLVYVVIFTHDGENGVRSNVDAVLLFKPRGLPLD